MYGKLFAQMYDGTLGTEGPWEALVTFQQMIILADQDGVVDMTAEALSRRTTIPLRVIKKGLQALEAPDSGSRSPDEGGRRILRLSESRDWGWRLVNHTKYRAIRTTEERRQYQREYWHKRKGDSTPLNNSTGTQHNQPIAEAYTEAKAEDKRPASSATALSAGDVVVLLPCNTGEEVPVGKAFVDELSTAYPDVDPVGTLREVRAWCIANPRKRKTKDGLGRFINSWFSRVQNEA